MLILLPPSETKAAGGTGTPLDLEQLSFPELSAQRERTMRALASVSRSPKRAAAALKLGPRQVVEARANLELDTSPTLCALERYTGVLYDGLDPTSLTPMQRRRAGQRIAVASALFGLVGGDDEIPAYRCSAGASLPRLGALAAAWRRTLGPLLEQVASEQLIIDLRSGAYQALAPLPDALTLRVLTRRSDGTLTVVSHHNKLAKGRLARLLVERTAPCRTIDDVAGTAERGGLEVMLEHETSINIVLPELAAPFKESRRNS